MPAHRTPQGNARRALVTQLWHEGKSILEIAAELDTTKGTVTVMIAKMRREGVDLPHRYQAWREAAAVAASHEDRLAFLRGRTRGSSRVEGHEILRGDPCSYCGCERTGILDHIVPTSKGGPDEFENLTSVCHRCNSSKTDLSLLGFLLVRKIKRDAERVLLEVSGARGVG
jgi:hypothetical protein